MSDRIDAGNQPHSVSRMDWMEAHAADDMERLFGRMLDATGTGDGYDDERFIAWLEREHDGDRDVDATTRRIAESVASRTRARVRAARTGAELVTAPLRVREGSVVGSIMTVAERAAAARCAPWVDSLAVAAGVGRELWDEPCDRWVELPDAVPSGRYLALGVAGDSMLPHLHEGDVLVVDPRRRVTRDVLVVARRPDDGYVVKYVSRLTRGALELSSFNTAYAPFAIARVEGAVIGVVVARLRRSC